MKNSIRFLFFLLFFIACKKDSSETQPLDTEDSTALLVGKWRLYKDSIVNTDMYLYFADGFYWSPNAGVYIGKANDFYDFQSNGTLSLHENNQSYSFPYNLYQSRLVFPGQNVHDTAVIKKLTSLEARFEWKQTSYNGGKYYRRLYLTR